MFVDHLRPTPLTTIQIVVGLWLFGVGLAFIVRGANGQGAWTVFHDGLSQHTPFSIGGATVLTGLVILCRRARHAGSDRAGDVAQHRDHRPGHRHHALAARRAGLHLRPGGADARFPFVIALGTSLYLGVHWGPGPRWLDDRTQRARGVDPAGSLPDRTDRFVVGFVLGGAVGWGSVWAVLAIGPAVQWMLPWFDRPTDGGWQPGRTWQRDAMQTRC